jgi:acyl-CoA thioesterase
MGGSGQGGSEFTERLGFEYRGVLDGDYVIELALRPDHMSRAQRAHGGLLFSLLDTCLGRAVLEHLPQGRGCATVEMKINYFRPVQHGRVQTRARLREMTRRLAYAEGEIRNEEGKRLASASGTFFLTETMLQGERERV